MLLGPAFRRCCKNPGGPWVGASIHLAAFWSVQRKVAIELLGCTSCHDGKQAAQLAGNGVLIGPNGPVHVTGGGVILISEFYLPTRTHDWL